MRKVCLFTSTRAEFGLLSGLARAIREEPELQLQLLVSGTHLSPAHGETVREIEAAGFTPDARVPILDAEGRDDPASICQVMGLAVVGYGEAFKNLSPDLVVILGDRYEAFCCAAAAQICRVPVAHIHGGETTEGAVDEAFRHAITKMSHLHFPCCEAYRQRIVQLGEDPARVYNVGALGVESIRTLKLLSREELASSLRFPLDAPFFLVTFHPVTLEAHSGEEQVRALLEAFSAFPEHRIIITGVNADPGGAAIEERLQAFAAAQPERVLYARSLGQLRYLSAMRLCAAVVGNSSSGIVEAPALNVPTVNIGDRQKGRVRAASVADCAPQAADIEAALRRACSDAFRAAAAGQRNPFDGGATRARIVDALKRAPLHDILKKHFRDLPASAPAEAVSPVSRPTFLKKCLVVGYGSIGKRHASVLEEMGCGVAVVSRHASPEEGRPCFRSVREAAQRFGPEYVVICNRTAEHAGTLDELTACGFSGTCLVEKPVLASTQQQQLAPAFATVVGYPLRFHPLVRAAAEIVAGKTLLSLHAYVGQYLPSWRPGSDYRQCYSAHREQGGGVLRDLSHELDYLQHFAGPWRRVCASGGHRSALEIDSDDQFLMLLDLQACPDVVCHLDYLSRKTRRFCSIQYEGGTLWLDFVEGRLTHNDESRLFAQGRNEMFVEMHRSVFEATGSGSRVCSWQEALGTLQLVEAAEESVRQEKWICRKHL
jgi:UDP-hydrolysing UDP-N-acetyl-D-glucosamine 2-epimerase